MDFIRNDFQPAMEKHRRPSSAKPVIGPQICFNKPIKVMTFWLALYILSNMSETFGDYQILQCGGPVVINWWKWSPSTIVISSIINHS
jgi:hypothetical protein